MIDIFTKINGFDSYLISQNGEVFSIHRNMLLKPRKLNTGHTVVDLCERGKKKTYSVHRLVLETFIGPCPKGLECCHNNGRPYDNRLENLRWDTRSSNQKDRAKHGTASKGNPFFTVGNKFSAKLTLKQVKKARMDFKCGISIPTLMERYEVGYNCIYDIVTNRSWKSI